MLFLNPNIIKSNADLRVGMVDTGDAREMSYFQYIGAVKVRIIKLALEYVKDDMANGASAEDSVASLLRLVHSQLTFKERSFPADLKGVVDEIMESEEFQNWRYNVKTRFLREHMGVNTKSTPIPVQGEENTLVSRDTIQLLEDADTFDVFLEGLASMNFID